MAQDDMMLAGEMGHPAGRKSEPFLEATPPAALNHQNSSGGHEARAKTLTVGIKLSSTDLDSPG